jgi:hypothetical protein
MNSTGAKGSQQTNKKTEKGFKNRELKSVEVCPGLAHRTVQCATGQCPVHQGLQLRTAHLREFSEPLRYNSPDCPVWHHTLSGGAPDCPVCQRSNGWVTWQAHRSVSGGAPDCPVRHAIAAFTKRLVWWLGL